MIKVAPPKPRIWPYPKPKRLPVRKRMTAILGMNYLDGILMLADTEEYLGGDAKSECDKLYRFTFPIGTVIMGGAGDSHLIECANQELHQFFASGEGQMPDQKITPKSALDALNIFAAKFVKDTSSPYKGFALESLPAMEMLVAVNCNNEQSLLFQWKHGRVVWIAPPRHVSIGTGVAQIHPMLRDVQFTASKECMLAHGLRMMHHAKRAVSGVGGRTEVAALQNNGCTHYFGTKAIQETEELVVNYDRFINSALHGDVFTIAAEPPLINPELEENIERGWPGMIEIFKKYRQEYKRILKPQLDAQTSADQQ